MISNRDGKIVHDGRDMLARIVGQIASPVRWDLCLETMTDLGVTGVLEMPPAGTLTGIAKRALKGVDTFALKTPDQLDEARAFCARHGEASMIESTPTWRMVVSPGKGTFHRAESAAGAETFEPGAVDRRGGQHPRQHHDHRGPRRPGGRVARRGRRPGLPRSTPAPTPPRGRYVMGIQESRRRASTRAILGIGSYRPSRVVPNSEIVERIDSSDEWIQQRSGIKQRRFATDEETVQLMSVAASRAALEHAGIDARQVDLVIVATVTHLLQTPAIATAIAYELGTDQAAAFDISAACAGFCHGVAMASDLVRGGSASYALVIGVERLSDITDIGDRGTAFIFADGAGAAVIGPSETPGIGPVVWGSDGEQFDLIRQKEDWRDVVGNDQKPGSGVMPHLVMLGNPVFRWASFTMAKTAQQALDRAGVSIDELDVFVPHQANMRIIDAMARSMKLPERVKIARDIAEMGNTSAASVPLALDRMIAEGDAKSGDIALLIAFGAGLAYAAQVVTVP